MLPTVTNPHGKLTLERLDNNSFLIRCLKNTKFPLGKFDWVCNLVTYGNVGHIKGFLSTREPKLSELISITYIGGHLGLDHVEWEHLDEEGNLLTQKTMKCRRKDASTVSTPVA